ncbi:hypothetical protein Pse7367_3258 [Thalassoporum mexicanum PCC 7367]|uniref:hypothetical protein n=1 Tax=Thalassoporum mexicanum TaxID=3457544 RepID=UPI00029F9C9C|nr:hypothetical protein [Pseudanabaena sp. PCC 7367]AFY71501.1 hypothetical protein Pse7367_3258 [Pseudanabaena sp. PCC 7367]
MADQNSSKFLSEEESALVDRAMMSSSEKFLTRLTISSMRVVLHIAKEHGVKVEDLTVSQIIAWMEQDAKIKREQGEAAAFLQW